MRRALTSIQLALNRVVRESGWAEDPNPNAAIPGNTIAMGKSWERAKVKGFIRKLTTTELFHLLVIKRNTRTIILAMLKIAAEDELRSTFLTQDEPSVRECADALDSVVTDIEMLNGRQHMKPPVFWTLTQAGVDYLTGDEQ